jgi:HEAT repeat protein
MGAQLLRLGRNIPFLHLPFTTPAERRQKGKMALVLAGEESMKASIPELVRLSHDTDAGVRLTAIEALSGFASNETNNLPALEAAQADPDFRVRAAALQAVQLRRAVEREVERLRNL